MCQDKESLLFNGREVSKESLPFAPFERGVLYGDGCFETMRVYKGHAFRLQDHLNRLVRSCRTSGFPLPLSLEGFKQEIDTLICSHGIVDGYLRVTLVRGRGDSAFDLSSIETQRLIHFREMTFAEKKSCSVNFVSGSHFSSFDGQNTGPHFVPKSTSYQPHLLRGAKSKEQGFDESILLGSYGEVLEGTASNIFLIKNGCLKTPSIRMGILSGVTRKVILESASLLGIESQEPILFSRDFYQADEIFLTNSLREIWPVVQADKMKVSSGKIGKITQILQTEYRKLVDREVKGS